jgi:3-hydroxyacyl-[acyl-carrier-protein] dehydratase
MDLADKNFGVYFMAIDNVKFRRKVGPGDTLRMAVETVRGGGKVWKFRGVATVGDEVACECDFTAMMDLPK